MFNKNLFFIELQNIDLTDSRGHQELRVQTLVRSKLFVDFGSFNFRAEKKALLPFLCLVTFTLSKHVFTKKSNIIPNSVSLKSLSTFI